MEALGAQSALYYSLNYNKLYYTKLHFIKLYYTKLHYIKLYYTQIHSTLYYILPTELNCTTLNIRNYTTLNFTTQPNLFHYTALHYMGLAAAHAVYQVDRIHPHFHCQGSWGYLYIYFEDQSHYGRSIYLDCL